MTKPVQLGDYSPDTLINFCERLPGVVFPISRLTFRLNKFPRQILETAHDFGFNYNPEHPEFTSEQVIAMIEEWNNLSKRRGKLIDLGIEGVCAELSPDGQPRVIIKLHSGRKLFAEPDDRNVYASGVVKRNPHHPGTVASQEMGIALAGLPGVNRVQFRRNEGAFIDVDITNPHLVSHIKRVAHKLLEYADTYRKSITTYP